MVRPERGSQLGFRCCTRPAGGSPATVGTPGAPCSRLRATSEMAASERSVESLDWAIGPGQRKQSCGPNVSESLQPREISTERQGGRADHVAAKATDCGRVVTGDPQDTLGVGEGARSEGLVRNRRDPPRRPTSGEGGGYKPMAKCHRAGRESEGLVVPWMAPTKTSPEGRGPALVTLTNWGKGEGMPYWANYPFEKAREPGNELSVVAKLVAPLGAVLVSQEPLGVTTPGRMAGLLGRLSDASNTGRPSVSRVRENRMHGLKGGFRSPGSQEHRA
jgi:hypothetical protein